MTVPAAPNEGGGSKIQFLVDDNSGTNRANLLRGYRSTTINGERVAAMGVYDVSGSFLNGNATLADGSTQQLVGGSMPAQWAILKARSANSGPIYVGRSDVTPDTADTTGGFPLEAGVSITVPCNDLSEIYLVGTADDGVAWIASLD